MFLVGPWLNPQMRPWSRFGINAGWLALLLALYNLWRWWLIRVGQTRRREWAEAQRRRHHEDYERRPVQEPDPTFDFSDRPPPGSASGESGR
jgi:hypothetical protein